ncbi:MAG: alpha/beta fold hydrolase [Comamonadaceae bacterium]|nr:MAG: alpha/beta fold hydrolase [Comamonadaceae bacterium]
MSRSLLWERDGASWPHRHTSRFEHCAGLHWHLQEFPPPEARGDQPPVVLLLHGTGASTHSWRGLAPLLAQRFRVLSLDLPGHGFTAMPREGPLSAQLSLPGMAQAIGQLLAQLALTPALLVGHSAGAAIGVRMCLDGLAAPQKIISLNGALLPLGGAAGRLLAPMTRLMAASPLVPRLFSWRAANPAVLQGLLDGTGSRLDATGTALYSQLVTNPGHAAGALGMMANWDLYALERELPRLATPLLQVVGANDRTISPRQAQRVLARLATSARLPVVTLEGLGHLAHEERPDLVAALV